LSKATGNHNKRKENEYILKISHGINECN